MVGTDSVIASVTKDGKFTVSSNTNDDTDDSQNDYVAIDASGASPDIVAQKKKGWRRIFQCFPKSSKIARTRGESHTVLLGPQSEEDRRRAKKTLVLDLDETLVHASFEPVADADFVVPVRLGRVVHKAYVRKRPGVDEFLTQMAPYYEIVVFTASLQKYADPVVDNIDKNRVVKARLFREACVQYCGNFIKDLSLLGRDLSKTIIIDNAPTSYLFHPQNALPCTSWFDDANDTELFDLIPVLKAIAEFDDVVVVLQQILHTQPQSPSLSAQLFQQHYIKPKEDDDDDDDNTTTTTATSNNNNNNSNLGGKNKGSETTVQHSNRSNDDDDDDDN